MLRFKLIWLPTIALVMGAGVVVGRLSAVLPTAPPPPSKGPMWFDEQLKLSDDQRHQMDGIWSETRQNLDKASEQSRDFEKQREQSIRQLLTEEQKKDYDNISSSFRVKRSDLDKQREALIKQANDRSRALLDDSQKARWDELTKAMHDRHGQRQHGPRGSGGPGGPGHPTTEPSTTRPWSAEGGTPAADQLRPEHR